MTAQPQVAAYPVASTPRSYPTASTAAQASLMASFKSQQEFFAIAAIIDILRIWGQLDTRSILTSWPALKVALAALIRDRFAMSASAGAAYYLQARSAAGVTGTFPVVLASVPDEALIAATLDSTGPYALLGRLKAAQPLPKALDTTGTVLSGAASRLIMNGARQTVLRSVGADDKAVAWMRVTAADPCSWCSMLSSRGPVYRSEASAGFKAHSRCRCIAAACFSKKDAEALRDNDLYRQWQEVTAGFAGKDAINAWRRYWYRRHPSAVGAPIAA